MIVSLLTRRIVVEKETEQILLYDEGGACVVARVPLNVAKQLIDDLADWIGEVEQENEIRRCMMESAAEDAKAERRME